MKELLNEHQGTLGWAGLAAYVVAWDVMARETLSDAVDRALEHGQMKYVAWGLGGIVTGHLFNVLPEQIDPIAKIAGHVGKWL